MTDRVNRFSDDFVDWEATSYGEAWAPYYDEIFDVIEDATIELLAGLAGNPPRALELAVGTGRVALPLARAGVAVTGVDNSPEMLAKLAAKDGASAIEAVVGDMADVPVAGEYPLIYLPFNTLFALLSQERQVELFGNVAVHLESGGRFVLDCFVPDLTRFDQANTRMGVSSIKSATEHAYEMSIHHPVTQTITSHLVRRQSSGETVVLPVAVRYAYPSEIDLMAKLAGLELENRWGWYDRRPFNDRSGQHVSVYRKPG